MTTPQPSLGDGPEVRLARIVRCLAPEFPCGQAGAPILAALARLPEPLRLVTAALLYPRLGSRTALPPAALLRLAASAAAVAGCSGGWRMIVQPGDDRERMILGPLAAVDRETPRGVLLNNVAVRLLQHRYAFEWGDLEQAYDRAAQAVAALDAAHESSA